MTTPFLVTDLRIYEGVKQIAYPDPISHGAPWTIGVGHTGREVHIGLSWTLAQCYQAEDIDIMLTCKGLDTSLPWWRTLSDLRQDCLVNQAFNLGVHGLLDFQTYLGFVRAGNWKAAAADVIHTLWAKQVGARAQCIAEQMLTNVHQDPK